MMHEKNQASSENDLTHFHKVRHGSFGWMKNQKGRFAKSLKLAPNFVDWHFE